MKKSKVLQTVTALLAAIAVFVIGSCGDADPGGQTPTGSGAEITVIKIGALTVETVPSPVSRETFEDEEFAGMASVNTGEYLGTLGFSAIEAVTGVSVQVTASPGAAVKLVIANSSSVQLTDLLDPEKDLDDFKKPEGTYTFGHDKVLWIQVTSEDKKTVNYYRVQLTATSGPAEITAITIGTLTPETIPTAIPQSVESATGMGAYNNTTYLGELWVNRNEEITGVAVQVTASEGATVKLAVGVNQTSAWSTLTFAEISGANTFSETQVLWFQVTSKDGITVYYRVRVYKRSDIAQLMSFSIGDREINWTTSNGKEDWTDIKTGIIYIDAALTGATLSAEARDRGTVGFAKYTDTFDDEKAAIPATFSATAGGWSFSSGDWLALEVTSENGGNKLYFKFEFRQLGAGPARLGDPVTLVNPNDGSWEYELPESYDQFGVGQPNSGAFEIELDFPELNGEPFDIRYYTKFTIDALIFDEEGNPVPDDYGNGAVEWLPRKTTGARCEQMNLPINTKDVFFDRTDGGAPDGNTGWDTFNDFPMVTTEEISGTPAGTYDNPTKIRVKPSRTGIGKIEITEIMVHN